MALAMRENRTVGLTADCVLIRRDCSESPIEDSAAPIHDRQGNVTGAVMVFHDVSKARARSLKLSHLAQHDALTDLPNRSLFDDRLGRALALAQRHRSKLAILYVDIDRFKHVNDTSGHAVGDRLLQSIAQRLLGCIRNSDTVSRQGGDEFVILLGEVANAKDAALAAFEAMAASWPEVRECHMIRGGGDFLLRLVARDTAQENALTRKLTEAANVARVQTLQTIRTSRTVAGVPL